MRLGNKLVQQITHSIHESFGEVDVYLFGSRVDDNKVGGDIDIAVDVELSRTEFRAKKVQFFVSMLRKDLDLKIDLVSYNTKDELFLEEIRSHCVRLT